MCTSNYKSLIIRKWSNSHLFARVELLQYIVGLWNSRHSSIILGNNRNICLGLSWNEFSDRYFINKAFNFKKGCFGEYLQIATAVC